jgi:DNA-binding NarL/FixJ family response regulator
MALLPFFAYISSCIATRPRTLYGDKVIVHLSEAIPTVPKSVLIVDDNQIVRKVVCRFFERLKDWRIGGEAGDGAEAIQRAMEVKPDLILLDCCMPNMNGVEAASVLKKMMPKVHFIVFTLFDGVLGARLSSAAGVDLVVPKADGLHGLVKAVQQILGNSGLIEDKAELDRQTTAGTALE